MQSTTSSTRTFITPPAKTETTTAKKSVGRKLRLSKRSLPWVIVVVLVAVSLFLFLQYRDAQHKLNNNGSQQVSALIASVRKLVVVPANETPTVATVVHANTLRSQTFFANAQDGDKVLVYSKEKEAILYRPSTDQIVTIAPVSLTNSGSSTPAVK